LPELSICLRGADDDGQFNLPLGFSDPRDTMIASLRPQSAEVAFLKVIASGGTSAGSGGMVRVCQPDADHLAGAADTRAARRLALAASF
jgi:hypothetical protein